MLFTNNITFTHSFQQCLFHLFLPSDNVQVFCRIVPAMSHYGHPFNCDKWLWTSWRYDLRPMTRASLLCSKGRWKVRRPFRHKDIFRCIWISARRPCWQHERSFLSHCPASHTEEIFAQRSFRVVCCALILFLKVYIAITMSHIYIYYCGKLSFTCFIA
jgi:hypothetical protein